MKKVFKVIMKKEDLNFQFTNKIDLTHLLKENILDNKSRYLMVFQIELKVNF